MQMHMYSTLGVYVILHAPGRLRKENSQCTRRDWVQASHDGCVQATCRSRGRGRGRWRLHRRLTQRLDCQLEPTGLGSGLAVSYRDELEVEALDTLWVGLVVEPAVDAVLEAELRLIEGLTAVGEVLWDLSKPAIAPDDRSLYCRWWMVVCGLGGWCGAAHLTPQTQRISSGISPADCCSGSTARGLLTSVSASCYPGRRLGAGVVAVRAKLCAPLAVPEQSAQREDESSSQPFVSHSSSTRPRCSSTAPAACQRETTPTGEAERLPRNAHRRSTRVAGNGAKCEASSGELPKYCISQALLSGRGHQISGNLLRLKAVS